MNTQISNNKRKQQYTKNGIAPHNVKLATANRYGKVVKQKNRLELWLDYHNHTMELVRTIIPFVLLIMQTIILVRLLGI